MGEVERVVQEKLVLKGVGCGGGRDGKRLVFDEAGSVGVKKAEEREAKRLTWTVMVSKAG